jgi:hypothetical protein
MLGYVDKPFIVNEFEVIRAIPEYIEMTLAGTENRSLNR